MARRTSADAIPCSMQATKPRRNVFSALRAGGIDYRFWYGQGLHRHGYYADALHEDLAVTGILAATLIGLPFAPDLDDASIARIVVQVHAGITGA